ncbi:MAG: class I lanthipeptide [Kofleriaceae bacterium]
MKKTATKTKLTLQREQIRILNPEGLSSVHGGRAASIIGCDRTGSSEECVTNTGKLGTCG